jgi:membrane fusion protein (multidrug efflux system)
MAVGYQDWRNQLAAIGSVHAVRGADLSAEVAGTIERIYFESGAQVKKGAPLLDLRANDELARLYALDAAARLAQITYDRSVAQYKVKAISQAQLDTDAAQLKSARAQVAEQRALIGKKRIRAPFGGRLGIRAVDPGQYVGAGTKIVTLQSLERVHVDFHLPQQHLGVLAVGQTVTAHADAYPQLSFSGRIAAIDPQLDPDTRNVQIRATLQNPGYKLLPGMFVNVEVEVGEPHRYLTLPTTSVAFNPYGETVFVLRKAAADNDNGVAAGQLIAQQQFVTAGSRRGDQVAILQGVKEGEQVVTSGQLKLKNGTPVAINNAVQPPFDPDPKPVEE